VPWTPAELKQKFLSIIEDGDGMSIKQAAGKLGVSPATASKWVHILEAERKVKLDRFGDMKLIRRAK
jgi:transposase